MKAVWLLSGLLTIWLLSACAPSAFLSTPATPSSPSVTPSAAVPLTPAAPPTLNRPQRAAQQAVLDLAQRLNQDSNAIQIEAIQPDEFPAGDFGCPQPDGTATAMPAFVTGQRIILKIGNTRYEYRAAGTQVVYCGVR